MFSCSMKASIVINQNFKRNINFADHANGKRSKKLCAQKHFLLSLRIKVLILRTTN